MFHPAPAAALSSPWRMEELRNFPWDALPHLAGELLAVMFVTTISVLLNCTGIEIATKREAGVDRELKAVGLANLLSAGAGRLCQLPDPQPHHPQPRSGRGRAVSRA